MIVLVGCEESQAVTQEFRALGHEAWSCDLKPTRGNPDWHLQEDVFKAIQRMGWDLIILHPDCTAMAVSGNRYYAKGTGGYRKRLEAIDWTMKLWSCAKDASPRVVLENPRSVIFPHLRRVGAHVQYIQPYEFGHPETKSTGLALYGVKPLTHTNNVYEKMMLLPKKERHKIWYCSPGKNRKRDRSETYKGLAKAMATQWG